eukprot:1057436-Amorphochlora_amoeboformis.AAC.2
MGRNSWRIESDEYIETNCGSIDCLLSVVGHVSTALEYKSTKVIKSAFYARIGVVVVAGVPFPLLYGRPQERTLPRISSCSPPATDRTTSNKSRFASPGDGLSHCDLTSLYFTSMRSRASNTLGPEHLEEQKSIPSENNQAMGSTCICITLDEACVQAPHVKPTPRDAPQPTVESVTSPCQFFAGTQSLSSAKMSIGSISALDSSRCGRVAQAYQSRVSEMGSGGHGNSLRRKFADMLRPTSKSTVCTSIC